MTYPPGPSGSPGYPPAQPPGGYGVASPSFVKPGDSVHKLPSYLQMAVVALGLASYLAGFGPMLTAEESGVGRFAGHPGMIVPVTLLAALLAAVGLLPKAKNYTAVVAVVAVLAMLLGIRRVLTAGDDYSVGWGLWLVLVFTVVQAVAAVATLLLDAGVLTAPTPKPKYDPYAQYGLPPGGGYYAQQGPQGPHGPPSGQHSRGGYQGPPAAYSSYGGYPSGPASGGFISPSGPSTGGFSTGSQHHEPQGPPTPPTGFPSFGAPQSATSATGGGQGQGQGQGQGSAASSPAPSGPTQP